MYRTLASIILAFLAFDVAAQQQPRGLLDSWRTDWSRTSIAPGELSVNVQRDAIPALDQAVFVEIEEAGRWLGGGEPVIALRMEGEERAYPLQILIWHEIVNDRFGDVPVAVTFCPLCYSAIAFDRRVGSDTLTFGVSGMLRLSDLVMFDRETQSLWQQLSGDAIVGARVGSRLEQIPTQIVSFDQFKRAYPQGRVLDRPGEHDRPYGSNPYVGYDDISERPWAFRGIADDRLRPMEKVVAVNLAGAQRAYPHAVTRSRGVINDSLGGHHLVIFHDPLGARSALDRALIAESRDLGSTGVFSREVGGVTLTFAQEDGAFVDKDTGSVWGITGRARSGPLRGRQLERIVHGDFFAFAWLAAFPASSVYGSRR